MSDNFVVLVGNVTRDPELRFTNGGAAVVSFGLAVTRKWNSRQTQQLEEQTSFFDVSAWSDLATNISQSVTKGQRVIVTGRLEQKSWTTDAGDKRSKVEVVADEVAPSLRWATAAVKKSERDAPKAKAPSFSGAPF